MSLPVFTWVLDHSEERLGNRLTLLALAEHSHDDGTKAFPSNETLQKRTRLSERAVRACLRSLEKSGAIECTGSTRNGTKVFMVVGPFNKAAESAARQNPPPAGNDTRVQDSAPEPSTNRQRTSSPRKGRAPTQVGGKKVSGVEEQFALDVLDVFNEVSGRKFGSKEALGKIILRHREHPEVTLEQHRQVIVEQFERPWWKGDPSPAVIYGNGDVFDRALNNVVGNGHNVGHGLEYLDQFGPA